MKKQSVKKKPSAPSKPKRTPLAPWKWQWADTLIRVGVPMGMPDDQHQALVELFHKELLTYAKDMKDMAEARLKGKLRVEILQNRLEELP